MLQVADSLMNEQSNNEDRFADIRPYNDEEVPAVVARLLENRQLHDAILNYKFPRSAKYLSFLLRPIVRYVMAREVKNVTNIRTWQEVVAKYMQRMIDTTISQLTYSGLEQLEPNKGYLFISNHRDIAMDPALVNWGLYTHQLDTVRIALGDNLLQKPYVSDLMRLNKSFIVNRSAEGMREKMKAYMGLSSYIDESVHGGHNIWIAQREGRAKDGVDASDPAVMKMLYMCAKKSGLSYADYVDSLHIVPVSISYEYDPCDNAKAIESSLSADEGEYTKSKYEDISSIVKGIIGQKGKVHVAFGSPLQGNVETPEELVHWLDEAISKNYQIQTTHLAAAAVLNNEAIADGAILEKRMAGLDENQRQYLLAMYANPLFRQQKYLASAL